MINGHKWFTSNGIDADFFIVMCRANDPTGELGAPGRMTQIIVPTATKGVNIIRGIGIFGHSTSDHCEIRYEDVRVPVENTLGLVGQGHQAAQDRLGAGRVYHCMNSVGQMWRAFDLMVERALIRQVHGGLLKDKQFIQGFIAESYMDVQSARLMTINAAEKVANGDPDVRTAISAIKVFVPAAYHRVVDRAIQVWGGAGVSNDLPLARMYLTARVLRLADGPDEVHKILMAKNILHRYEGGKLEFRQLTARAGRAGVAGWQAERAAPARGADETDAAGITREKEPPCPPGPPTNPEPPHGWTWPARIWPPRPPSTPRCSAGGPRTRGRVGHYHMSRSKGAGGRGRPDHDGRQAPGLDHLCIGGRRRQERRQGQEGRRTVFVEPMDVLDVGRMAVFADPTGAAAAVWQPKGTKGGAGQRSRWPGLERA